MCYKSVELEMIKKGILNRSRSAVFHAAPITSADLRECLAIRPHQMGQGDLSERQAFQVWEQIIDNNEACGHVAICRKSGKRREIVAAGIGVFVTSEFADAELANPQPGLNARIVSALFGRKSVIADYRYVARANAAATLQQVIMICSANDDLLTGDEETLVRNLLARSYVELFAGYRLRRMLTEVYGEKDLAALANYPALEIASNFTTSHTERGRAPGESVLCIASGANFRNDPASPAVPIFLGHMNPRFGLSRGEKDLLQGALAGLDDAQLAIVLCRTEFAVKRRWRKIFEKVASIDADVCPETEGPVRGPQRRHRVLAYLRNHPEEIRPFQRSE